MTIGPLGHRLLTHIALRLAVATVLLVAAFVIEAREPGVLDINSFFGLIALVYAVSLLFIASLPFVDRFPWLSDVHFASDVVLVSGAVAVTGGIRSLFSPLYVLPIIAASTVRLRRGALQVAALSTLLFAGLVLVQYGEVMGFLDPIVGFPSEMQLPGASVAQYTVALNVFGLFAIALVSGSLAERARSANVRLERASETIADLQAFNQYVIDSLVSGLATADEQNRLLTFNRSAASITGRPAGAVLGHSAGEVLQLPSDVAPTIDDHLRQSRSKRIDYEYRRPDGATIDVGVSAAHLPLPDGRVGYVYTFQDITDVRRLERDVQAQKRLAAVGEMAAGIAHEIRNPLASMSGSMQILRQELALTRDQARLMDIVLRESERLNETIRSFLAYARPQRVEMTRLDLRRVVQDTATLLRNGVEVGPRHTIEVALGPAAVWVDADERQIVQIVWNLATNGLRAMPDGGVLQLTAAREPAPGGAAVLLVADHGVGMAASELEQIFEPFRGGFADGSGLGLAIVHRVVRDHRGSIDVQSQPGHGTSFRVTFPPAAATANDSSEGALARLAARRRAS